MANKITVATERLHAQMVLHFIITFKISMSMCAACPFAANGGLTLPKFKPGSGCFTV